jgi:hypothetical protein
VSAPPVDNRQLPDPRERGRRPEGLVQLLDQHQVWVSGQVEHEIESMSLEHVIEVLDALRWAAKAIWHLRKVDLRIEACELAQRGLPGGAELRERAREIDALGPHASLEETPLVKALRRRLDRFVAAGDGAQ